MALILPLLLLLVFGIIEFGRVFNTQITITHAAREGVRHFAITGDQDAAIVVADGADPNTTITQADVAWSDGDGNTGADVECVPNFITDETVGVPMTMAISRTVNINIPMWGDADLDLTGTGTMRCGG